MTISSELRRSRYLIHKQGKKHTFSNIPVQMPQTVIAVEGKGESNDELGASLQPSG